MYFSPFCPFGPLVQLHGYLPLSEEDNDDEEDKGRALGCLDEGGGGGTEESLEEDGMARFSDGGICDAHQVSLFTMAPNASPSSALVMVGGLLTIFLICSAITCNLFYLSFPASFHCSFIQLVKLSFSFWYCLSLFSFWAYSKKGLSFGCTSLTTSQMCSMVRMDGREGRLLSPEVTPSCIQPDGLFTNSCMPFLI
jgi:hypothetical protein